MTDDVIDERLADRLVGMASGLPCVQLLMCRLSPIVRDMQSRVKERYYGTATWTGPAWNVSGWRQVKSAAARCSEKFRDCLRTVRLNSPWSRRVFSYLSYFCKLNSFFRFEWFRFWLGVRVKNLNPIPRHAPRSRPSRFFRRISTVRISYIPKNVIKVQINVVIELLKLSIARW